MTGFNLPVPLPMAVAIAAVYSAAAFAAGGNIYQAGNPPPPPGPYYSMNGVTQTPAYTQPQPNPQPENIPATVKTLPNTGAFGPNRFQVPYWMQDNTQNVAPSQQPVNTAIGDQQPQQPQPRNVNTQAWGANVFMSGNFAGPTPGYFPGYGAGYRQGYGQYQNNPYANNNGNYGNYGPAPAWPTPWNGNGYGPMAVPWGNYGYPAPFVPNYATPYGFPATAQR